MNRIKLLLLKETKAPNGVICAKPKLPNWYLIPNLNAVSVSPRNVILASQSELNPMEAQGEIAFFSQTDGANKLTSDRWGEKDQI